MSQVTAFRDKRPVVAKPYAPGGCPVHVGKQKCGETQGLEIIMDFHRMYQEKMNEIDVSAGGDSLQEKVDLQEQWISDLTEQNKLLARVIQELETETIGKIHQMEAKLNNSVKALGEEEEKALKSNGNKIEEPREDLKVMPEVQEILEKMSTENVRLKQVDVQSEQELAIHSMSKKDSDILEIVETAQPELPAEETPSELPKDAFGDLKLKIFKPEDTFVGTRQSSKRTSFISDADKFVLLGDDSVSTTDLPDKQKGVSKTVSSKSVHLMIEDEMVGSQIVEPEKDKGIDTQMPLPPRIDSVPVFGTTDSLELKLVASQVLSEEPDEKDCNCELKEYWNELDKLKEENERLREGAEIQRLKEDVEEKMKRILELNEENRTLNDMINLLRKNQSLKWTRKEREEYEYLKQRVKLLEQGKGDTANITSNLQTAVDLYVDTIELLESSEQKLKAELDHYRIVNETLHENILNMRDEMESFKYTFQKELDEQKWINFILQIENFDVQQTNQMYLEQVEKYQNLYKQLMELNCDLEMEHVNSLQDLSMIESQFNKYQTVSRIQEEEKIVIKNQLKKLTKKNKCYEEVVQFFKEEMSVMSDELLTLQEVLNVTNISSLEENNKLIGAMLQLRRINDRLVNHLCTIEKQAVLENQINQINEARINELQNIISAKNNDLTQHDEIIQEMRKKLNNATRQNSDLKKTIKNLTDTVVEIQEGIKTVERDQIKNLNDISHVESKVCLANGDLESIKTCMEQKNQRILELENQLKDQGVNYILATKELGMLKEKKAERKELINSLKEQLSVAEKKNEQILADYQTIMKKVQEYSSIEHMKNYELNHYKSLFEEMKMSLEQLNNGLDKCEASNIHFYEDYPYRRNNFPVAFDELKKSMANLKKRISEADFEGGLIEDELLKVKNSHLFHIPEEMNGSPNELDARIMAYVEEQSRLNQLVEQQKEQIEQLRGELELEKKNACAYKKSVSELKNEKTSSNAEMEISQLKCELNKSIYRQKMLNEENDQIHTQMINLRKKLNILEERYEILSQEKEEYKVELKRTIREKEYLAHRNHDMTKTIEQMRSTHDHLEKQCRYYTDRVNNLELELSESQTERDNVFAEAQNVARVVKMWFQEQSVVNDKIRQKFEGYKKTITDLRTMMKKMSEERSWIRMPMQQPFSSRRYGTAGLSERRVSSPDKARKLERHTADIEYRPACPWGGVNSYANEEYPVADTSSQKSNMMGNTSYDSNSSPYTSRSLSPRTNSLYGVEDELEYLNSCDWISPDYKETETDADDGEEIFINKIHLMTSQVQEANKRWQKKMRKDHSSKSCGSNK